MIVARVLNYCKALRRELNARDGMLITKYLID